VNSTQRDLLIQAQRSVGAARLNLASGFPEVAVSRAYYAMFYCASALLEGEGLRFSSHSAVVAAFGRHFARTRRLPPELHQFLVQAERARSKADYVVGRAVPTEEAMQQIAWAERFLAATEAHIGRLAPDPEESGGAPHQ
jgi:uncharacterized protein (UPF0332 family)